MTDSLLINFNRHSSRPAHLTRATSGATNSTLSSRSILTHSRSTSAIPYAPSSIHSSESVSEESGGSDEGVGGGGRGSKRRYHCLELNCEKTFSTSGHRSRHHKIHKGEAEKRWACPFPGCTSKFTRKDNQTQHYKTHFPRPSKAPRSLKLIGRARTHHGASAKLPQHSPSIDQILVVPECTGSRPVAIPSPLFSPAVAPAPEVETFATLHNSLGAPPTPLTGPDSAFTFGSPSFPRFPPPPGLQMSEEAFSRVVGAPDGRQQAQLDTHNPAALTSQFVPPLDSPPPWLGRNEAASVPTQASTHAVGLAMPPPEVRLEESRTLGTPDAANRAGESFHPATLSHLSPIDHHSRAPGLVITPAGFDAARRAYSLAECGSAGISPDFAGDGGVLDAAARRWSWQSGLPSAMPMLPSPAGGSYFGQVQAAVLDQPAFTGHFGADGGMSGFPSYPGGESIGMSDGSPESAQPSSMFESRSGSLSSGGEVVGWTGGSHVEWTPTKSVDAPHISSVHGLVESPMSMSPVSEVAWGAVQPLLPNSSRLGIPSLHLSTQPITPSYFGTSTAIMSAPAVPSHAQYDSDSPWSAHRPAIGRPVPPTQFAGGPFSAEAEPYQTPKRVGLPSEAFVTPTQQSRFGMGASIRPPRLEPAPEDDRMASLESPGWSHVVPLEPAPLLDGYNEV